jgi:hypothetical protein
VSIVRFSDCRRRQAQGPIHGFALLEGMEKAKSLEATKHSVLPHLVVIAGKASSV